MSADDEIRIIKDAAQLLGDDVGTTLWAHGWAVTDLEVDDNEPLVWYWPPTAPIGYGGQAEPRGEDGKRRDRSYAPQESPWIRPTRITRRGAQWRVEYGQALAQTPARPTTYSSGRELLGDLERIEWWPMTPEEARKVRAMRIVEITMAMARDDHYRAVFPTEPYAGRLDAIRDHQRYERLRGRQRGMDPPQAPRQPGDLNAQAVLVDAAAWASALRTARAGGTGWGLNGRERPLGE